MAITLPTVPAAFLNPKLDYKIAQEIQTLIAAISWMDRAYHIARVGIIAENGLNYPQIYLNNDTNEHANIRPDNEIGSYSFFEIDSPFTIDVYEDKLTCFFSVVVWGNLDIIEPSYTYDYTSELVKDVTDVIIGYGAGSVDVETRPEKIFDKYRGVTQELKQHLMRKYTAFKISFEVIKTYTDNC